MDAETWDQRYAGADLVWSAEPNRFLVEQVDGLSPGRALDLATGEGRNAVWLAQQGWQVTAVDFSPVGIDKARGLADRAGVTVDWVVADVLAYDPPERTFDLVIVVYLQIPADQRRVAHRSAAAAVAPGGTLLVIGHDLDNLEHGHGGPPDPDVLLTADGVVADLADTGLAVVSAGPVPRPVETPEGVRSAIDTLVRAQRPAP